MQRNPLRLHHELLLLALHDDKGTLAFGQMIEYGLGGAILTELLMEERLRIIERGRWQGGPLVEVVRATPTGDPAVDAALDLLSRKRRASPASTVSRIANLRGLRNLVARDLARRGILTESERQVLLLFRRRVYPTVDPRPERALIARLRQALEGSGAADARTSALVGLADATDSLSAIYSWSERRRLRRRIKELRELDPGSRAAREAIQAVVTVIVASGAAVAASG